MNTDLKLDGEVKLIASSSTWIDGEAVRQLYGFARFQGVRHAIGFPDLQAGRGVPSGVAMLTQGIIYPSLIGPDIGCGMGLFKTGLLRREADPVAWTGLNFALEQASTSLAANKPPRRAHLDGSEAFDAEFGRLSGGNHFAEIQSVENVLDLATFRSTGIGKEQLVMLVHSGSGGLGESVFGAYATMRGTHGCSSDSAEARDYLHGHEFANRWARASRAEVARRMADLLGTEAESVWDEAHNSLTEVNCSHGTGWLHRKGAVAATSPVVVIPGTRGSLTYLVKPVAPAESHLWSLAHGAGRKWSRSDARQRIRERFGVKQLETTPLGGRVVCEDRDLLYEEAPDAYKSIDRVVRDLVEAGLVTIVATLRPILTYKTRRIGW